MTQTRSRLGGRGLLTLVLIALLSVTLLPLSAAPASAAPSTAASRSLSPDGSIVLGAASLGEPVPASTTAVPVTSPVSTGTDLGNPVASVTTLGAPATGAPVVLGDCGFLWYKCIRDGAVTTVEVGLCDSLGGLIVSAASDTVAGKCKDANGRVIKAAAKVFLGVVNPIIEKMIHLTGQYLIAAADGITNWVLTRELASHNTVTEPVVSCKAATGWVAKNCSDNWFLAQFSLMRQIGLFLIIPLFMIVVIQSIVRGSMFFLLRAALIMLPAAVLGSVVVVTFGQIILNITNDIADAIASNLTSVNGYQQSLHDTLMKMNDNSGTGFFAWIWILLLIVVAVVIFIELIIREVGIYLVAFFLPLMFGALVWPATSRMARRGVELWIAIAFSKDVILGACSLGLAAIGHEGVAQVNTATGNGNQSKDQAAVSSVMGGVIIFAMAGIAGMKVIAIAPGISAAAENRFINPGSTFSAFQMVSSNMGKLAQRYGKKSAGVTPQGSFKNNQGINTGMPRTPAGAIPVSHEKTGNNGWKDKPGTNGPVNGPPSPSGSGGGGGGHMPPHGSKGDKSGKAMPNGTPNNSGGPAAGTKTPNTKSTGDRTKPSAPPVNTTPPTPPSSSGGNNGGPFKGNGNGWKGPQPPPKPPKPNK